MDRFGTPNGRFGIGVKNFRVWWTHEVGFCLRLSSCCKENHYAADSDVGVDDILEDAVGEMVEQPSAEGCADGHTAEAIEIVDADGRGHEAIVGADEGHNDVAAEHIDLRHGHIAILVVGHGDEIEYGGRSLHIEETTHESAEHAGAYLCWQCRPQPYPLVEETEVKTEKYEYDAEDMSQYDIIDFAQTEDWCCRYNYEGAEDWYDALPVDIAVHADSNVYGVAHRQQACQRSGFGIRRHEERQHRHDEDTETETRCALDEAGNDAEHEDGSE